MERRLISVALVTAPLDMAMAMVLLGWSTAHPLWWEAGVKLAILGGITIMIYGINFFALPFHAKRAWKSRTLLAVQLGAGVIGAWLTAWGLATGTPHPTQIGTLLSAVGGFLFLANIGLLMTSPTSLVRERHQGGDVSAQRQVDVLATVFTSLSGINVVIGTALGWVLTWWIPPFGRWDLVWGHFMVLGFFYAMASGTSYHTLGRWSRGEWRSVTAVRLHLIGYLAGFPLMVMALALDMTALFAVAGPLMALSMLAWLVNILPMTIHQQPAVRSGIWLAMLFLIVGATLGASFAINPAMGPRLRGSHALANLLGFASLLICGFGNSYVPQLSGHAHMRWRRLSALQMLIVTAGVAVGAVGFGMRMYGRASDLWVQLPTALAALGMVIFAAQVIGTFAEDPAVDVGEPIG